MDQEEIEILAPTPGRERLRQPLPRLVAPTTAGLMHGFDRSARPCIRPVLHHDGGFYAAVNPELDAGTALSNLLMPSQWAELTAADMPSLPDRFAVLDGQLMERIHEPVWLVETRDSAGRINTRENARMGVSIVPSFLPHGGLQRFRCTAIPPSGSPRSMFAITRLEEAERLLPSVASDTPWGQTESHRHRFDVLRPDLFTVDDRAGSLAMLGPMLVDLGHASCGALSRRSIGSWLELRRLVGAGAVTEAGYAAIQDAAADLLRELRNARSADKELTVTLKRARNCAVMLVHRLDVDNRYVPEPAPAGPAP